MAIYDVKKGILFRLNPHTSDEGLVAIGKTSKQHVLDLKFDPSGKQLILAGMKEIVFISWSNNVLKTIKGVWGNSSP